MKNLCRPQALPSKRTELWLCIPAKSKLSFQNKPGMLARGNNRICYNSARRMNQLSSNMSSRLLIIALCFIGIFQLVTIRPGMVGGEDSALYLLHARNIAFGRPYLATGYIYSIETAKYSPAGYPPVFPIMLAPLFRIYGPTPVPYKVLLVCVLVLTLFVITLLYQGTVPPLQLLLLVVLLGFNPYITDQKNEIMSDLPFLLFIYVALLLFGEAREPNAESPSYLLRAIFAGLFSYLAYGTRAIGVGIIFSIIAFVLFRYRRVPRPVIMAVIVFAVFAGLQSRLVSINSDYLRIATLKESSPLQNLHFYAGVTTYLWDSGIGGAFPRFLVFAIATSLSLVGALRQNLKSLDLTTFFSIGYGLFLIFWPHQQARYLLPLLPVYFYFLVCGLQATHAFLASRSQAAATVAVVGLTVVLLMAYVAKYATSYFGPSSDAWDSASATHLYSLVQAETPKDAIIIASAPRALALYTARQTARFPEPLDSANLTRYIAKLGATHLLVSRAGAMQWARLCGAACVSEPVFACPDYVLYKTTLPISKSPIALE